MPARTGPLLLEQRRLAGGRDWWRIASLIEPVHPLPVMECLSAAGYAMRAYAVSKLLSISIYLVNIMRTSLFAGGPNPTEQFRLFAYSIFVEDGRFRSPCGASRTLPLAPAAFSRLPHVRKSRAHSRVASSIGLLSRPWKRKCLLLMNVVISNDHARDRQLKMFFETRKWETGTAPNGSKAIRVLQPYERRAPCPSPLQLVDMSYRDVESMLTDKFKEGRPKSVVVPQNIDTVRELIMQDRHVKYREVKAFLGISQKIELTGHPPHSPDLASKDFYFSIYSPSVKNKLRGQRFWSSEEAVDAFKVHVLDIPQ
ncbi:hypothetical protein EVAR_16670_1 [Eumeta japonica]|uniref:Histone-lysine N-methyltransferase SETMAR n=1 Tax=Eumeta variegata TaxID=151549 RepID=A0A4C1UZL0_EUMVA|nr:hypothetical protein EVAR_16670_1 [Eumeta japonica]